MRVAAILGCFLYFGMCGQRQTFKIENQVKLAYYYFDEKSNAMLVPTIEELLYDLRFSEKETHIFSEVRSLNIYKLGKEIRSNLNNIFSSYDRNQSLDKIDNTFEVDKDVAETFKDNDFLLCIIIKQINNIIEYQLTLFKFDIKTQQDKYYLAPVFNSYRTTSVLVDITKEDYKQKLSIGLKELVKESNVKPTPILRCINRKIKSDVIVLSTVDTLKLLADVLDKDSPKDRIRYKWDINPVSDNSNYNYLTNEDNNKEIIFNIPATYTLTMGVTDGISDYQSKSYTIEVIHQPRVKETSAALRSESELSEVVYYNSTTFNYDQTEIYAYKGTPIGRGSSYRLVYDIRTEHVDKVHFAICETNRNGDACNMIEIIPIKNETEKRDPYKFNIILDSAKQRFQLLVPEAMDLPARYKLMLTGEKQGILGPPYYSSLNFNKFRKFFLRFGYEVIFVNKGGYCLKGGIGRAFFFRDNFKYNIILSQNLLFPAMQLNEKNVFYHNYQEAWLEVPLRKWPFGWRVGVRNNVFNNTEKKTFENEMFLAVGLDFYLYAPTACETLSITYASSQVSDSYMTNQFTVALYFDLFNYKKKRN